MLEYRADAFQWFRGHTFLQQCQHPLRVDIETAMRWRLLPPLVAHALGLPGYSPFAIPWIGFIITLAYLARILLLRFDNLLFALAGTLLYASTSAGLMAFQWFGINDIWVWLGHLIVAFSPSGMAIFVACLLGPWVDERFLIGLPLAWVVRSCERGDPLATRSALFMSAIVPYVVIRLAGGGNPITGEIEQHFLRENWPLILRYSSFVPFAWWTALRAAWLPALYAVYALPYPRNAMLALTALATATVTVFTALDFSRSAAIVAPLSVLGLILIGRNHQRLAPRIALCLAILGLLLPTAVVVANKVEHIDNIVTELSRISTK